MVSLKPGHNPAINDGRVPSLDLGHSILQNRLKLASLFNPQCMHIAGSGRRSNAGVVWRRSK